VLEMNLITFWVVNAEPRRPVALENAGWHPNAELIEGRTTSQQARRIRRDNDFWADQFLLLRAPVAW
jgi:hypothetical protein